MPYRSSAFDRAVGLLESGGVLLLGTDTLPGFHCRADRSGSVRRILDLKGRQAGKSLLLLAGSYEQAALVTGDLDPRQASYCRRCWPGPFSLVLPAGRKLSRAVNSGDGTVAVRVPDLIELQDLVLAVGFPLVSTSANRSGEEPLTDMGAARTAFESVVDGVWEPAARPPGPAGSSPEGASALLDLTVWPPVQLRTGPLPAPPAGSGRLDGGSRGT